MYTKAFQPDNLINNAILNDKRTHYGKSLAEEEYAKPLKETYPSLWVVPTKISFITRKSWIKYWKRQTRVSIIMTSTIGECVLLYTVAYCTFFLKVRAKIWLECLWQISPNTLWWMEGYYLKRRSANVSGYRGSPLNSRREKSHWWRHPLPVRINAIRKRRSFWIYCWWSSF